MAVMAISGAELSTHRYNTTFGARKKTHDNTPEQVQGRHSGNNMKRVPVVVLLAMTPAMLNGDSAAKAYPINSEQLTEVLANIPMQEPDEMTAAFPGVNETQQSYPLGVAYFSDLKVQQIKPAIGNGAKANIVLTKLLRQGGANDVLEVYYVKHSWKDNNINHKPPEVEELIYHNLGGSNDYLGIKIRENIYKPNNKTMHPDNVMEREVKLDDESAQLLIDLMTGDTKWNNKTSIIYRETTNPKVMSPQVY